MLTKIEVQTALATFVHPNLPETHVPYKRLMGYQSAFGALSCKNSLQRPTQAEQIILPEVMIGRLGKFMLQHLLDYDPEDAAQRMPRSTAEYLCFSFAYAMHGEEYSAFDARDKISHDAREGFSARLGRHALLEAGDHGVIVDRHTGNALHSMIGLGDGQTMQVVDVNGTMALAPQRDVMYYYQAIRGFDPVLRVVDNLPAHQVTDPQQLIAA